MKSSSAVPPVAVSRRRSTLGLLVPNPKSKLAEQCREVLRRHDMEVGTVDKAWKAAVPFRAAQKGSARVAGG